MSKPTRLELYEHNKKLETLLREAEAHHERLRAAFIETLVGAGYSQRLAEAHVEELDSRSLLGGWEAEAEPPEAEQSRTEEPAK